MLQYPVGDAAFTFTCSLISLFYAPDLLSKLQAVRQLLGCLLQSHRQSNKQK